MENHRTSPFLMGKLTISIVMWLFTGEYIPSNPMKTTIFPWFSHGFCQRYPWEAGFHQLLVTQPRRIAAISLARRVGAEQMDVAQGKVVGQRGSLVDGPWAMGG